MKIQYRFYLQPSSLAVLLVFVLGIVVAIGAGGIAAYFGMRSGAALIGLIVFCGFLAAIPGRKLLATRTMSNRVRSGGAWNPGGSRPYAFWRFN